MTAIAGINFGEYALLATDDCVTVHANGEERHELGGQKIYECAYGGFLAGSGWEPLVRAIAAKLKDPPPKVKSLPGPLLVRWIEKQILDAREDLRELREYSDVTREQYDRTRVFLSVVVAGKTQILIYSPDRKEDGFAGGCGMNDIILSAPGGAPAGCDVQWQADLRKRLRPFESFSSKLDHANYHCRQLGGAIMQLSEYFPNVSRSGIIGMLTASGSMQAQRFPKGNRAPVAANLPVQ